MKISAASLILLFFAVSHSYAAPEADLSNFRKSVLPLLSKYCMDCHDSDTKKGSFDLESLAPNMLSDDDVLEQWRLVEEQLHFDDMPPDKKQQPSADEKSRILQWVRSELFKTQRPDHLGSAKLHLSLAIMSTTERSSGNGSATSPLPRRIWRLRPALYDGIMPRLGEKITGLANGLNLLDGPDFKDYAAPYFLDEAATAPLLSNAKKIAAALVGSEFPRQDLQGTGQGGR